MTLAYKNASRILRAVKASGLPYTEVSGWKTRGHGDLKAVKTIIAHHTATPRSFKKSSDYPTMGVVRDGRAGLRGPLAQLGLGRSGRVYLIAAGLAYHAGRVRTTSYTNAYSIGIEAEGAMEAWPKQQYDAYVRLCAALRNEFGATVEGHKTVCSPPGRKVDPSFNIATFKRDVEAARKQPSKPAPKPPKKGFLGMTGYEQYSRTGDQTIPAKSKARIRMHPASKNHAGPHYIAQPKRKGQKFLLGADVSIYRVPAGADVKAQIVVAIRDSKGKWEIKRPFAQASFPAGVNGHSAVQLSQAEQFGYSIPKGGRAEYQVEISNYSSKPVTVKRARSASFYE